MNRPLTGSLLRVFVLGMLCAFGSAHGAPQSPPAWVLEAAERPTPAFVEGAPVLTLFDEWAYEVLPNGRVVHTHRYAMRVLNRSGCEYARAGVGYLDKRDKVTGTAVWLVRAGKEIRPPKKRDWADVSSASPGAIYDESRSRTMNYADLALVGDVFASETRVERGLLFGQLANFWNAEMPTLVDRCVLRLAPGWSCQVLKGGNEPGLLQETAAGQSYTWELNNRPYRRNEPAMAAGARRDAVVWINLIPPAGASGPFPFVPRDWAAVAQWDWNNATGQCDADAQLVATVQKLTAGCSDSLARMRQLSRYVQQLRYVGVNRDLAVGGGMRPRKATEVHAKGWGDCKDKANLLVAMLREAGIEAFSVTVQSGGGKLVDPVWPSLQQFNHAIVGIRVDESVQLPTVGEAPGVGRLLFFDATDPDVLLGDLPIQLQGTKGFVVAQGTTALTTLPTVPTAIGHRFEVKFDLVLSLNGSVSGRCELGGPGVGGANLRELARITSTKDLRLHWEEWISGMVRGARLKELSMQDDLVSGDFRLKFDFAAPPIWQPMSGGLMLLRLDSFNRNRVPTFPDKDRRLPIGLESIMWSDELRVTLPPGLVVDETPAPIELRSPYGSYSSVAGSNDGVVTVRRTLELAERDVSVGEYGAVRKFFSDLAKNDRISLILREAPVGGSASAK